jgi:hypothetical protein
MGVAAAAAQQQEQGHGRAACCRRLKECVDKGAQRQQQQQQTEEFAAPYCIFATPFSCSARCLAHMLHVLHAPCTPAVCTALIANKAKEISRLNSVYNNLLRNAGVAYYEGKGSLLDKNTVQVGRPVLLVLGRTVFV